MNTMRRRLAFVLAVALLNLLSAFAADADLRSEVRRAIIDNGLRDAAVAISVTDPGSGQSLVRINDTMPMIPASNMKLLTTGTALHVLGADFEFRTRMVLDGDRLIVIGDGDPGFGDPELLTLVHYRDRQGIGLEEFLNLWVDAIVALDIDSIREVVVDDRIFDRAFVHESWPRDQLNRRYCAEIAGLTFHLNVLHFHARPLSGGPPDVSKFEPYAPWIDTTSNRATSNPQAGNTLGIARPYGTNKLTFFGNVRRKYTTPVPVTIHDMPTFFARLLADRLRAAGVAVESSGAITPSEPATQGTIVGPVVRTPISTAVTRCNRDSHNLYAEALAKRAGYALTRGAQPGSWANAAAAIRLVASKRIANPAFTRGLIVSDGSGLSRDNRVTAALMTAWLDSFHRDPELGPVFINSFAVGGASGTLEKRFRGAQFEGVTVQAKSGYINGVSCLSGYVTSSDGQRRSFSVLVNQIPAGKVANAKQLQETVVALIAESLRERATVKVGG